VLIAAVLVAGLTITGIAENALRRVLFEMPPRDPVSLAAACVLLVAVAVVASVPPALCALRVDPVRACARNSGRSQRPLLVRRRATGRFA
jgi:hypothetical protein